MNHKPDDRSSRVFFPRKPHLPHVLTAFRAETFPKFSSFWLLVSDMELRQIEPVARNNGAGRTVYRWEESTQELTYDYRKVAEHMTMAGNGLYKSRERCKD